MCGRRLICRLTRIPSFLLLLLHLFGGSTWNVRSGGGERGGRGGGKGGDAGTRVGGGLARGQELPSRDEGYFQFIMKHPEVVVDTKSLPDGKEETIYLDKEQPMRVFFVVEADAAILSLIVSPCSSKLSWMFCYLYPAPNEGRDKEQDMEEDDEILQQRKASSSFSSSISGCSNRNTGRLLKSYTGSDVSGFESANPIPGVYSLVLVNEDDDGSVRLFASTSPQSDSPFPLLPDDRRVRITSSSSFSSSSSNSQSPSLPSPFSSTVSSSSSSPSTRSFLSSTETDDHLKVHLTWRRSPTEEWHLQPVEYCLSANNFGHLRTYCAATALARGDPRPSRPPYAGFRTPPNRTRDRGPRQSGDRAPRELKRRTRLTCVGSKTTFTFSATPSALVNRRTVYFDVFAVNRRTQSSVTYEGVQLKPVSRRQVQLKFKKLKNFRLKAKSDNMLFQFKVMRSKARFLLFSFRACVGQVRVEISRDDQMLYENRTKEGHPLWFRVKNLAPYDTYDILVSNDGKGSASFQVIVTSATKEFPFPDIPADVGIRVVQSNCHSLELVWSEPNRDQTYHCLVVEPLHSIGGKRNRCMLPRPSSDKSKILCHPSRIGDISQNHNKTVADLESGLFYRLTIYVRKSNGGQWLSYQPIVAATRQECLPTDQRNNYSKFKK